MIAAGLLRFGALLLLWVVIAGTDAVALPVGAAAAGLATWASLRLLPPAELWPRAEPLAMLLLRFPWQALRAGTEVAILALDPRRRPSPATVAWMPRLPPGDALDAFLAYASLLPGTLPAQADPDGTVLVHCLDTRQPVTEQLAQAEARFAGVLRRA